MPSVGKGNFRVRGKPAAPALNVTPPFHIASEIKGAVRIHIGKHPILAAPGIMLQGFKREAGIDNRVSLLLKLNQAIEHVSSFFQREGKGIVTVIGVMELDGNALYLTLQEFYQIRNLRGINAVDGNIRKYIVMAGITNLLHHRIKAVVPYPVMGVPQAIDANPDGIGINLERKGAVGCNAHAEKQLPRLIHDIMNAALPVLPEKRLSSFNDEDPHTPAGQVQQQLLYLVEGKGRGGGPLPKGAMKAAQIAAAGYFETCQDGSFLMEQRRLQIIGKKIQVPGQSHGVSSGQKEWAILCNNFLNRLQADSWIPDTRHNRPRRLLKK
jgi:hypothetical protein